MPAFDIVLSGGGTRGVALGGALSVLEQRRPLPFVHRMVGTSAGAITAVLGAAGFTSGDFNKMVPNKAGDSYQFGSFMQPPKASVVRDAIRVKDSETRKLLRGAVDGAGEKMVQQLGATRPVLANLLQGAMNMGKNGFFEAAFDGFLDRLAAADNDPNKNHFFRAAIFSLLEFGGMFDPELFRVWMTERLKSKWAKFTIETTLKQFHNMTWLFSRELSLVVSDTTAAKALVLNHRTAPDFPVVDAVRASMSVPLVWPEVIWDQKWGKYLDQDMAGHTLVDGGVLANLAIKYVTEWDDPEVRKIMGPVDREPHIVIALLLDDSLAIPGDVPPMDEKKPPKIVQEISRVMATMGSFQNEALKGKEELICRIPVKGHPPLELQPTGDATARLQALLNSGRCAMTEHLKKRKLL
jgi:predicted acylesterase/phospholipase RssA